MLENNYKFIFEEKKCMIYDQNNANRLVTTITMLENKLFPLNFSIRQEGILAYMVIDNKNKL